MEIDLQIQESCRGLKVLPRRRAGVNHSTVAIIATLSPNGSLGVIRFEPAQVSTTPWTNQTSPVIATRTEGIQNNEARQNFSSQKQRDHIHGPRLSPTRFRTFDWEVGDFAIYLMKASG